MHKEVTIYDIAKELNISTATISRALNGHPAINAETKNRVQATAQSMGYRANKFASNLRSKKTNTIGVIVPTLNSSFMAGVLSGMEKKANEVGYNLLISQSLESEQKEIANAKTMLNSHVDALLVSVAFDTEGDSHFKPFIKKGIPLLFFDRILENIGYTSVVIDNLQAGYQATHHLIEQGCKSIAHITGNLKRNVYTDRLKGYKLALAEAGITFDKNLVFETDVSVEAGIQTVETLLKRAKLPDGLFVTNDTCAASCINTLKKTGISVPHDIAVVGFNNENIAALVEPSLTTIHYPSQEMGVIAVQTVINCLNGSINIQTTDKIVLNSALVIRESSLYRQYINPVVDEQKQVMV